MTQSTEQELYEQWREDYALADEPNYSVGTDFDCRSAFRAGIEAARRAPVVPQVWLPTAENINELPEPLRKYICDLETSCDPSGMVRHNTILRDQVAGLQAMYRKAADALAAAPQPPEAEQCPSCRAGSPYACTCPFKTDRNSDPSCFKESHVQLPEPDAAQSRVLPNGDWGFCSVEHARFAQDWDKYETRLLYTEQQVHQLLAAKEQSND